MCHALCLDVVWCAWGVSSGTIVISDVVHVDMTCNGQSVRCRGWVSRMSILIVLTCIPRDHIM